MAFTFRKATKEKLFGRIGFVGPAGSGKTYTALRVATYFAQQTGSRIAYIDSEHGAAKKYADRFDFDVLELETFSPDTYVDAIEAAEKAGYQVIVIDSLSHAWIGKEGALEQADNAAKRYKGNTFAAWRDVTPMHNRLVEKMLAVNAHLVITMRSKVEWVVEQGPNGKSQPKKVGMQPVQREGLDYEFDVVGDMDLDGNVLVITKTRCDDLTGKVIAKPGEDFAATVYSWLTDGAEPVERITKEDLLAYGKTKHGLTGADIAAALKGAGVEFDPYKGAELRQALDEYVAMKAAEDEAEAEAQAEAAAEAEAEQQPA